MKNKENINQSEIDLDKQAVKDALEAVYNGKSK
jgi:hypothetical protein